MARYVRISLAGLPSGQDSLERSPWFHVKPDADGATRADRTRAGQASADQAVWARRSGGGDSGGARQFMRDVWPCGVGNGVKPFCTERPRRAPLMRTPTSASRCDRRVRHWLLSFCESDFERSVYRPAALSSAQIAPERTRNRAVWTFRPGRSHPWSQPTKVARGPLL